MLLKQ